MEKNFKILTITTITGNMLEYYQGNPGDIKTDYDILIEKSLERGLNKEDHPDLYLERHHIVPRCLGGKDEDSNYVLLTYREHVLAHMLLYVGNPECTSLMYAFTLLIMIPRNDEKRKFKLVSTETLELVDLDVLEKLRIAKANSPGPNLGRKFSGEVRKKMSESRRGKRNGRSHSIQGPEGRVYETITDAALMEGVSRTTIRYWIKYSPEKGYKEIDC